MIPFKPRELDIFFTSGRDPVRCLLNRASDAGLRNAFNFDIPTHTGFMTIDHNQWFATELNEDGIEEDSFEKYLTQKRFKDRLMAVYRWTVFDSPMIRSSVLEHLVELRQADKGYDWVGAVLCNKAIRKMFPKLRSDRQKYFCSENVFEILRWKGWKGWPVRWGAQAPHPNALYRHITTDRSFSLVWEAPIVSKQ